MVRKTMNLSFHSDVKTRLDQILGKASHKKIMFIFKELTNNSFEIEYLKYGHLMINSSSQDGSTCDYMASNNLICVGRIYTNIRVLSEKK